MGVKLESRKVTVMGLGLHGGGIASARFCAERGAEVTVTDLRSADELADSIAQLRDLPIRFVLGEHRDQDFRDADLVIKNPAVRRTNRYLQLARAIETDISMFLQECPGPVIAVTGSKGKSTTASAVHAVLSHSYPGSRLGGNITTSPLGFLAELTADDPVVLELSSFQLGDLPLTASWQDGWRFTPAISILTNMMRDHQDYYGSMEPYIRDKQLICAHQQPDGFAILPADDPVTPRFTAATAARCLYICGSGPRADLVGGYLKDTRGYCSITVKCEEVVPTETPYAGPRINLLSAAVALRAFGIPARSIREGLSRFSGIPHRMELLGERNRIALYNDTAATIPTATLATVRSLKRPVILIAGGADKELELDEFREIHQHCHKLVLLAGSASERIAALLPDCNDTLYDNLEAAFQYAMEQAQSLEEPSAVVLSPGAASFNMFQNEFDRGNQFRALAQTWLDQDGS
ncbi:UDP-N-acetylmuramoyl-L-alanine--D-glutamate ligase [Spirochaeta africana]|uniref:UDP-N-acetylmuramoylalanine--D-glutamate ligase n=1 Tax=Spirochaeta africana (strain ATCC 700263 / DSM 8902 / Z-7692) TaxID=889378 RepID=H9UIY6_SPIAZ|nr:UDP-N-acetylmuramoyl-L-alanine--D-glutamate ligase [Spirochaeta africana]AFG37479.1 UDP-N-acetylmuramoylalanine--D-glutamate ligase [Spirochaeta africana DSM 8902]